VTGIPAAGPLPAVDLSDVSDTVTGAGIRVVAVRRPNVPLVQLRLHVPLGDVVARDGSVLRLLPKTLLAGTGKRTGSQVAADFQRLGMLVGAGADVDSLSVSAGVPAAVLPEAMKQLADVVAHPSFPQAEVVGERERVVQEIMQETVDPMSIATHGLDAQLFPRHPYSDPLPTLAAVRRTGRSRLSQFQAQRVLPSGSLLVAVGDVDPDRLTALVDEAFAPWAGDGSNGPLATPHISPRHSGVILVDRPGAVQSNVRLGTRCAGRNDPGFPALSLASTVLGGYFTSRLVDNLRERHGYTYSPRSGIDEHRLAAVFAVRAEVGTDVTAAALTEIQYELGRLATTEVPGEELDAARRYISGVLGMAAATQSGLAGLLGAFVSQGLEPTYLERFLRELAAVDAPAVADAAARFLGPAAMTTVVVGDAGVLAPTLEPLGEVTVVR
jgi:zinc protease